MTEGELGVRGLLHTLRLSQATTLVALGVALVAAPVGAADAEGDSLANRLEFVSPTAGYQPDLSSVNGVGDTLLIPPSEPPTPADADASTERAGEVDFDFLPRGSDACDGYDSFGPRARAKQYPDNWMWGCGGSPYRNGPGLCDDWKVGPVWHVSVEGIVMSREDANLDAIAARALELDPDMMLPPIEVTEQFSYGPGGRVFLTGLLPPDVGYQMFAGYEGVEEWNAAVVFEKDPDIPGPPPPGGVAERRSIYYRSSLHAAELNFMRTCHPIWHPYCGVRYLRFTDELSDLTDQIASPDLPGPDPEVVTEQDMLRLFDIDNNLIGFQIGMRQNLWQISRRFSLQGFVNSGVYHNRSKRTNLMWISTTQYTADDTDPPADPMDPVIDETDVSTSTASNLSITERSDIAYVAEASLTGVCQLNKCLALRAGYQFLWIENVFLAEDAYLGSGVDSQSLTFQGWHAGVEYRR